MRRLFRKLLAPAAAQAVFLSSTILMFGGCYSDPNVAPEKRVRLDDFPPADGRPNTGGLAANPPVTSNPPVISPGPITAPTPGETGGKIAVGDSLTISFSDAPRDAFPQQLIVKVGSDGTFTLPYNKIVHALGRTPTELEREIHSTYVPSLFVNCTATVKPDDRYFFVGGEVRVPSRVIFTSHSITVLRAITTVGGFTDFANKSKIELRRANGGKTEYVNYKKALKDPKLDLPVFPNDQIIVPRGL